MDKMRKDVKNTTTITLFLPNDIHKKLKTVQALRFIQGESKTLPEITIDKLREALVDVIIDDKN